MYGAKICALKSATKEIVAICYMLQCLGVVVSKPSVVFGDNLGVIQNASLLELLLKKKHMALAFHCVCEAAAAGIIHLAKIVRQNNIANILTKALPYKPFMRLSGRIFHR